VKAISVAGRFPANHFKNMTMTFDVQINDLPQDVPALGLLRQIAVNGETA